MNPTVEALVKKVHEQFLNRDETLVTAESCTGGLLGGAITTVPGSSTLYPGGIIAYDNRIKQSLLGVSAEVLETEGAVSEPVAAAMAEGVKSSFDADAALSITGIAGPGGGTPEKPVGLVYVGYAYKTTTRVRRRQYEGNREQIRRQTVEDSLKWIVESDSPPS